MTWPPPPADEKPHCGLRLNCSSGANRAASSMRRLRSILRFQFGRLGAHQAEHGRLARRQEAQGPEIARPLGIVFQEERVDIEPAEQPLRDGLVAALGHPHALQVAPAHMEADEGVVAPFAHAVVDEADIGVGQFVGILAARHDRRPCRVVAIAGQRGIVELDIAAAGLFQIGDFLPEDGDEIGEEVVPAVIDRRVEAAVAQPEMQHRGRCDGDFGNALRPERGDKFVIAGDDGPPARQPALGIGRRRHAVFLALRMEAEDALRLQPHPVQRFRQAARPDPAPELPVGDRGQAELVLKRDDLPDAIVLDVDIGPVVERAGLVRPGGVQQPAGPHETPDMLDPEGRTGGIGTGHDL